MPIIRAIKDESHFSTLRAPAQDERLSYRARGLLWYLLSKPNGWQVQEQDLIAHGQEGRDAIRSAVKELKAAGYVKRIRERNPETGAFDWVTEVYEQPTPLTEKPSVAPFTAYQETGNQELESRKSIDKRERLEKDSCVVACATNTTRQVSTLATEARDGQATFLTALPDESKNDTPAAPRALRAKRAAPKRTPSAVALDTPLWDLTKIGASHKNTLWVYGTSKTLDARYSATPAQIAEFGEYWRKMTWQARKAAQEGRQVDPPTPTQVLEDWPKYQAWSEAQQRERERQRRQVVPVMRQTPEEAAAARAIAAQGLYRFAK